MEIPKPITLPFLQKASSPKKTIKKNRNFLKSAMKPQNPLVGFLKKNLVFFLQPWYLCYVGSV